MGDSKFAIVLGAIFATLLVLLCAWNAVRQPFRSRLEERNASDYHAPTPQSSLPVRQSPPIVSREYNAKWCGMQSIAHSSCPSYGSRISIWRRRG